MQALPVVRSSSEFTVVLCGGLGLAACAGYVNTLLIVLGAPPVTHMTGSISHLGTDTARGDFGDALLITELVLAFLIGAVLSGVIIGSANLRLGRRYGLAVLLQAALLGAAAASLPHSLLAGAMLAACSAGLQNAMASSYRSLIVRTTHVTGVLTDIGFIIGQMLAGHAVARWRLGLLCSLLIAFVAGGVGGAAAGVRLGPDGLWLPAGVLALGGLGYFVWRRVAGVEAPGTDADPVRQQA